LAALLWVTLGGTWGAWWGTAAFAADSAVQEPSPAAVEDDYTPVNVTDAVYSSKAYHFGFKRSKNGQLPSIDEEGFKPLLQDNGAIFLGDTTQKELYLTFDNGYENGLTVQILDVLKEKQVPAVFFVTGHYVKDQPELLKRMASEGHLIGNHSWSHPDMSQISVEKIASELDQVKKAVADITGQQDMPFMRAPRGIFNARMLATSREQGYTNVFWSIAYKDWDVKDQKGSQYAYDKVVSQLHPGAVILLHSVSKDNADALGRIIDEARKQGYTFKSLDQLEKKNY
jgi:peptidoglycan-N-acetylmuramic acid deacetylase